MLTLYDRLNFSLNSLYLVSSMIYFLFINDNRLELRLLRCFAWLFMARCCWLWDWVVIMLLLFNWGLCYCCYCCVFDNNKGLLLPLIARLVDILLILLMLFSLDDNLLYFLYFVDDDKIFSYFDYCFYYKINYLFCLLLLFLILMFLDYFFSILLLWCFNFLFLAEILFVLV